MHAGTHHSNPKQRLRQQNDNGIQELPMQRHARHFEVHQVQLCVVVELLHILFAGPVRDVHLHPRLGLRWCHQKSLGTLQVVAEVIHGGQQEQGHAGQPAPEAFQAVLPGVDLVQAGVGENRLKALLHKAASAPQIVAVEPRVGVVRATRPQAVFAVRAVLDGRTEVTEVHLPRKGVPKVLLLADHRDQVGLKQEVGKTKQVDPDRSRDESARPTTAPGNLRQSDRGTVHRVALHVALAAEGAVPVHLPEEDDRLQRSEPRVG
mmetsp:Transcript_39111/g.93463  ORF Transcript_39111/g.93463 Transcript_39111/m.93463 type:complete len:263 (+) Transcript_39111:503-1291(+)